jgi:hypothetical protein
VGKAISKVYAENGMKVAGANFNDETGQRTIDEINANGGKAIFKHCNVSDETDVKNLVHTAEMLGFFRQITERRTVLFPNIQDKNTCRNTGEYLSAARELGEWAAERASAGQALNLTRNSNTSPVPGRILPPDASA